MASAKFFQIGFNKCGTTSLFHLFSKSGVSTIKFSGQKKWLVSTGKPQSRNIQIEIQQNINAKLPPLFGLEQYNAFFDMEYNTSLRSIENFRRYKELDQSYPHAKFLLNTRYKWHWLRSRARHAQGNYLRRTAKRLCVPGYEVLALWSKQYDEHCEEVRSYFLGRPRSFLEFDIENDNIDELVEFCHPEFKLNREFWKQHNQSSDDRKELSEKVLNLIFQPPSKAA